MTDTSAILASLDRFIERFARHDELRNGHRVATQYQPMAIEKPLINKGSNHSGHSGHPKQETFAGVDHEQCEAYPSPAENSDSGLARKVLSVDGYSGKSGKSVSNQQLAGSHPGNADGQSGNSSSDQDVASDLISIGSQRDDVVSSPADTSGSDSAWWRDQYERRSRHRELGGRRSRAEAELLAWHELEWRWHKQHGEQLPPGICGGCRKPIGTAETILLIDGNRLHGGEGHECLAAYGRRWRATAVAALHALGLDPPPGFEAP
jgi:hypothetical protein